ncbi:MAG: TonB-dependent receptor plug domain-containing protein [Aliidongia sp.]
MSTSPGVEPSVSTVVDGVVLARSGQATLDLVDLDHVEVLQGPQGTLFGKNASAGVVNISTKEPSDTFQGFADAGYYSGNEYRVDTSLSGPIIPGELDGLLTLLGAGYDGNVTNLFNGEKVNGYLHDGFRTKLLFTPNADLSITLAADYLHSEDTGAERRLGLVEPSRLSQRIGDAQCRAGRAAGAAGCQPVGRQPHYQHQRDQRHPGR